MPAQRPSYEELAEENTLLCGIIAQLQTELKELRERVTELEQSKKVDSHNSGKAPASDERWKAKSLRKRSGKGSGGQQGHKGETLKFVANPEAREIHKAAGVCDCGRAISQGKVLGYRRRQVFDIPAIKLQVTEHQAERRQCSCGKVHQAAFPKEVSAPVQYGASVKAISSYLQVQQLLPYQRCQELMADVLGVKLSQGTLANSVSEASKALSPIANKIEQALATSELLHVDETGARIAGTLNWLHVISHKTLTHYQMSPHRGRKGYVPWLETFEGKLVHDFYSAYQQLCASHACCNAHLLRDLTRVEEQFQQAWATDLKTLLCETKMLVESSSKKCLEPPELMTLRQRYRGLLDQAKQANPTLPRQAGVAKRGRIKQSFAHNLALRLDTYQEAILRFALDPSVPFDNNQAERDLRMMRLKEKISGAYRSPQGAAFFARLRGYCSTLRKQGLNILDALTRLFQHDPLLPQLEPT
jgi:transposase